jgi:hypothetical protein
MHATLAACLPSKLKTIVVRVACALTDVMFSRSWVTEQSATVALKTNIPSSRHSSRTKCNTTQLSMMVVRVQRSIGSSQPTGQSERTRRETVERNRPILMRLTSLPCRRLCPLGFVPAVGSRIRSFFSSTTASIFQFLLSIPSPCVL